MRLPYVRQDLYVALSPLLGVFDEVRIDGVEEVAKEDLAGLFVRPQQLSLLIYRLAHAS